MVLSSSGTATARTRIVLLAPANSMAPSSFGGFRTDPGRHRHLLGAMQRLRGSVYLEDGAISQDQISIDGRHKLAIDDSSWHVLLTDQGDRVLGCARYRCHETPVSFNKLGVRRSALAECATWGRKLRSAVEQEIRVAQQRKFSYVEVGGWALSQALRFSKEAIRIALASYVLGRSLGGCIGLTTATRRNNSSSILRRIGGQSLQVGGKELPHYFDPVYQCEMEVLRFDSTDPSPRFEGLIDDLSDELQESEVIRPRQRHHQTPHFPVLGPQLWLGYGEAARNVC